MRPYHGLLTAVVTPFRADGAVNEDAAVAIDAGRRERLEALIEERHDMVEDGLRAARSPIGFTGILDCMHHDKA